MAKDDKGQVRQLIDATIEDMKNETITAIEGIEPEELEKAWQNASTAQTTRKHFRTN